jgi:hypothetical protein
MGLTFPHLIFAPDASLFQPPLKLLARVNPLSGAQSCTRLLCTASLQCQDMPDAAAGPNDDRVGTPKNLWRVRKVCAKELQAFCVELACGVETGGGAAGAAAGRG